MVDGVTFNSDVPDDCHYLDGTSWKKNQFQGECTNNNSKTLSDLYYHTLYILLTLPPLVYLPSCEATALVEYNSSFKTFEEIVSTTK